MAAGQARRCLKQRRQDQDSPDKRTGMEGAGLGPAARAGNYFSSAPEELAAPAPCVSPATALALGSPRSPQLPETLGWSSAERCQGWLLAA